MKLILFYCIFLLGLPVQSILAQQQHMTQEEVELDYLERYEKENPPTSVMPLPGNEEDEYLYGARIQRFVTLLASSNERKRLPVSILIYGQSITGSKIFTDYLRNYLKRRFPYAALTIRNRAIGGFVGEQLVHTAEHDLYHTNADLIIFHVYGGENHGELETMFARIRKYSTADILLLNHHVSSNLAIEYDESSYGYLGYIANKYNCELVDLTKSWGRYLVEHNLKVKDLLRDDIHPNKHGNWLMTQLIGKHIRFNTLFPSDWYQRVQTYYVHTMQEPIRFPDEVWSEIEGVCYGENPGQSLVLRFEGSRVDLIAGIIPNGMRLGSAKIVIDKKPVSLYTITRPSAGPGTWWPLVRRINHKADLIQEKWTMRIDRVNPDSTIWTFHVCGSKTGFDGSGTSDKPFVSTSGRVVIEKDDFMFTRIKEGFHVAIEPGFEASWEVEPLFKEIYKAPHTEDPTFVYKTTIVQGLSNGSHTLEIIPLGDGIVPIEAIEIHRPPLVY